MDRRIVKRYAEALFNSAEQAGVVDLVESDLGLITYTFETIPSLEEAITSPLVPPGKKKEIMESIFGDKIHEITLFYLYLVIDKRREGIIRHTEPEYIRLANEARGIVAAQVTSAVELSDDEAGRLKASLSEHMGRRVDIKVEVDPAIIGGIIVRIGDTVMDGSIKGHLDRIKEEFLNQS